MHAFDPKDLSQSSQSLDEVVNLYHKLYKFSPLPFCIRDQSRTVVYTNDACKNFFTPLPGSYSGDSFNINSVELELATVELESFIMGPGTALCRTFNFNGEFYQLRIEVRAVQNELYALWFINFFPDYQALFQTSNKPKNLGFDIDIFLAELTTKAMVTLCFSVLGFHLQTISRFLGVSEKAISQRLVRVKFEIKKYFTDYDEFKIYCMRNNVYVKMITVILEIINVKNTLNK